MATGGGDQVWTWKKRKTVAASRAARGGNEITTVSVAVLGIFLLHTFSMGVKTGGRLHWEQTVHLHYAPIYLYIS